MMQEEVAEKHALLQAVNSLVHANQVLQDEQREYKALLREAQQTNAALKRQAES